MLGLDVIEKAIDLLKTAPNFIEMIYKDLAQPGVRQVGLALEITIGFCNTLLYPFRLANAHCNKIFTINMERYGGKLEDTPDEKIFAVPPENRSSLARKIVLFYKSLYK